MENYDVQPPNEEPAEECTCDASKALDSHGNVCFIDAMAVVQAIKKGSTIINCSDFAKSFAQSIQYIMPGYDGAHVIFSKYMYIY